MLEDVKKNLGFKPDVDLFNEGNDRPNVKLTVSRLQHGLSTFKDLDFLLDLKKTILYFDSRNDAEQARAYLTNSPFLVVHKCACEVVSAHVPVPKTSRII
ncbi:hypothetical protein EDD21DRAFT_420217 [Dissophora ornata]|nr:hypothetical protein EDD21DRAFT_420217 [Dissophora ornata]